MLSLTKNECIRQFQEFIGKGLCFGDDCSFAVVVVGDVIVFAVHVVGRDCSSSTRAISRARVVRLMLRYHPFGATECSNGDIV